MSNIVLYKLSTSEEVIARQKSFDDETIVVEDPRVVTFMPNQQTGQVGVSLMPFMIGVMDQSISSEVRLARSHIVASAKPSKELEDGFIQQTTGIDLTTKLT